MTSSRVTVLTTLIGTVNLLTEVAKDRDQDGVPVVTPQRRR